MSYYYLNSWSSTTIDGTLTFQPRVMVPHWFFLVMEYLGCAVTNTGSIDEIADLAGPCWSWLCSFVLRDMAVETVKMSFNAGYASWCHLAGFGDEIPENSSTRGGARTGDQQSTHIPSAAEFPIDHLAENSTSTWPERCLTDINLTPA